MAKTMQGNDRRATLPGRRGQARWKLAALLVALAVSAAIVLVVRGRVQAPVAVAELGPPAWHGYEVVNVYPHDPAAFTQGLLFHEGFLYESTGQYGRSSLRKTHLETGEVVQQQPVAAEYFAEGLAAWGDRLIQLTWKSGVGFVYGLATFELERTFEYPGEGWGLAAAEDRLIMSDGTPILRFLDPETLAETGRLRVTYDGQAVAGLNELEVVGDEIYANVRQTDQILIIDPESGRVTGVLDLRGLLGPADRGRPVDVLNGIAYDAEGDRLFVTGKLWPKLFEIRVVRGQ